MFKSKLILVSVLCGSPLFCDQGQAGEDSAQVQCEQGHIDTKGLAALIASEVPLVILDARSGHWDDGKRIAQAQALSYETTAEQARALIPSKDSLVVVYCTGVHCPASGWLAKRLAELGYSNVLKYEEGIEEWLRAGFSVRETR